MKGLYGNIVVLISDNSLSSEIVRDISNLGSVSSNWNSRNVKDYDKNSSDPRLVLENLTLKNNHRLVIGNLNINSISTKFDNLKLIIQGKIDMLVITEIKTDSTFPLNQFGMQRYSKPYRFDRNRNGGGVFINVREDIPSRELKIHNNPEDIESIFIEINLRENCFYQTKKVSSFSKVFYCLKRFSCLRTHNIFFFPFCITYNKSFYAFCIV